MNLRPWTGIVAFFLVLVLPAVLEAQTGTIAGLVIDEETAEPLIGAAVFLESDPTKGTTADLDGLFRLTNVPVGIQTVVVRYVSYQTKNITGVGVSDGSATNLNITMASSSELLHAVIVQEDFKAQSVAAVYTMQKKAISVQDGISRDIIARSPDNNTGEVLKRLPGTTIQDNKFAVVRGLSDRYNNAMVNGLLMPSTEPDRKAFAFDLYPSNLLDYLIITKTAQPDLPGEFAGGLIQLATRDIPDENFLEVSLGTGLDTRTTGQTAYRYNGGSTDWLGLDDGTRALPDAFDAINPEDFRELLVGPRAELAAVLPNNWQVDSSSKAGLNRSLQVSGGITTALSEDLRFGLVAGLTYSASNSNALANEINYFGRSEEFAFDYLDDHHQQDVLAGGLINLGLKYKGRHKFNWRNDMTVNSSDRIVFRKGFNQVNTRSEQSYYYEFISRLNINSSLSGEHAFGANNVKLDWILGYNQTQRNQPDTRNVNYNDLDSILDPTLSPVPSFSNTGHFYSFLDEAAYSAAVNLTLPFQIGNQRQSFKAGGYLQEKQRDFSARIFGYVRIFDVNNPVDPKDLQVPPEELYVPENFSASFLSIDEITTARDRYRGNSSLRAAYGMFDNRIGDKLRLVWGLRAEQFNQSIETGEGIPGEAATPVLKDTIYLDLLPSLNMTYAVNDKINIRLSGSQTVARPEFRERALFVYYNFQNFTNVSGNINLLPTDIYNADLRFEYYPGAGQILSVSAFYKYFDRPISMFRIPGEGGGGIGNAERPINESYAVNIGVEAEIRKNFDFVGLEELVFNANLAYIRSRSYILAEDDSLLFLQAGAEAERALIYQSPWIVNVGFSWLDPEGRFDATVLFNSYGSRRVLLGNIDYPDVLEAPRNRLDAQIGVRLTEGLKLKLTGENLLRAPLIWYWDTGGDASAPTKSNQYDEDSDVLIRRLDPGAGVSLSLTWRL